MVWDDSPLQEKERHAEYVITYPGGIRYAANEQTALQHQKEIQSKYPDHVIIRKCWKIIYEDNSCAWIPRNT